MKELHKLTHDWIEAFNTHDIDALLALYHDDAEHFSPKLKLLRPETEGYIRGKSEMRSWWADAFKRLPNLHYQIVDVIAENNRIFLEYIRETPGEVNLRVGELLEVKEGKIITSRVYHS